MKSIGSLKKGDKVVMRLFTGALSSVKEIEDADKEFVWITTGKGLSKFSKETGKMVDPAPKAERFANYIELYDESVEEELVERGRKAKPVKDKATVQKVTKKVKKVVRRKDDDIEELE